MTTKFAPGPKIFASRPHKYHQCMSDSTTTHAAPATINSPEGESRPAVALFNDRGPPAGDHCRGGAPAGKSDSRCPAAPQHPEPQQRKVNTMAHNPHYLPGGNPVRGLLDSSIKGRLTSKDLEILDRAAENLPHGETFDRVKPGVIKASNEIAALAAEGRTGEARRRVDEAIAELAPKLSEAGRSMDSTEPQGTIQGKSLKDFAAEIYEN